MSTVKSNALQLGQSATASNNFTWHQPSTPDGTVRLGIGNAGATSGDVLIASSTGISTPSLVVSGSTAPTNGMFLPAANTLAWSTNSSERLRLDASGNLGLGVTPSAWSALKGFDISTYGGFYGYTNQAGVTSNAYYGSSGWTYKNTAAATLYQQINGQHSWQTAPSGTAGNAISFTQAMTLDASGNLLVGTTSSPTGSPVGKVLALNSVDIEGTGAVNVTTSTTLLSRTSGVGGMFFVQGYNASGGAQGWWLLAGTGSSMTTVASGNSTGLTVTFSMSGGGLRAVTASGTLVATCISFTQ